MEKVRKSTLKRIIAAVSIVAVFALSIAAFVTKGFQSPSPQLAPSPGEVNGGMVMDPTEDLSTGVSFTSYAIPKSEFASYGVSPYAETAQQITAVITPADAAYQKLDWSVAWENGGSGKFGNGKNVEDYVSVVPTSDGALTATLTCHQAFGEKIILKANLRNNENLFGTRAVQYQQKFVDLAFSINYSGAANVNIAGNSDSGVFFDYPLFGSSYSDFITKESSATKNVVVTTLLSDVYTIPATVTDVKLSTEPSGSFYSSLITLNGGQFSWTSGTEHVVGTGTGANASLSDFSLAKFFFLDQAGSGLDWNAFRQSFNDNARSARINVILSAKVNGEFQEVSYTIAFNKATSGFATGIDIGSTDIIY